MIKLGSTLGLAFALFMVSATSVFSIGVVILFHHWLAPGHPGHAFDYSLSVGGSVICIAAGLLLVATLLERRWITGACSIILVMVAVGSLGWFYIPSLELMRSETFPLNSSLAIALLLLVSACLGSAFEKSRNLICLLCGAALFLLSMLSFGSFWFDGLAWFSQTRHDNGQISLSPIGALIGLALVLLPKLTSRVDSVPARPLLVIAFVGSLLTTICWHGVDMQQAKKHLISQELALANAGEMVESWYQRTKSVIVRLGERWQTLPDAVKTELWQRETDSYFRDLEGLKVLVVLDASLEVRRFEARIAGGQRVIQTAVKQPYFRERLKHAMVSNEPHVFAFGEASPWRGHLFVVVPIQAPRSKAHYIVGVVDPRPGLDQVISRFSREHEISVRVDGMALLSSDRELRGEAASESDSVFYSSMSGARTVNIHDFSFEVASQNRIYYRAHWDTYLAVFVLLSGLLATLLVMVYRFVNFTSKQQEQRLRRTFEKLNRSLRGERQLRADHEKIHRYSKDLLCSIDSEDRFVVVSPASVDILGYQPEEMIGHRYQEFLTEGDLIQTAVERQSVVSGKPSRTFINRYRTKEGQTVVLSWSAEWSPVDDTFFCVARDVTLQEEADRLRQDRETFFSLTPEMFCILGLDARFYQANQAFIKTMGYSLPELRQYSYMQFIDSDDVTVIKKVASELACGTAVQNQAVRAKTKSGERIWLEYSAIRLGDVIYCVARDVTELRRTQQQLLESQQILKIAEDTAHVGGWMVELDTGHVHWSDAVCRIHELPVGTQPEIPEALNFYVPSCRKDVMDMVEKAALEGVSFSGEFQIRTSHGKVRWVRTIGAPVRNQRGEIVRLQGAIQDVTESRLVNDQVKRLAGRLQTTLESITDAFFTLDPEWQFTFLNSKAEKLLQRSAPELLGKSVWREFPESIGTVFYEEYHRAVELQNAVTFEAYYSPLEDWFDVSAYPSEEGIAVYFRSIKDRKEADGRLRSALRELEESNSDLESFAYVSSHDLQEPLRKIQTFSDRLLQTADKLDEKEQDYLRRMQAAAARMQALIRSLLDYSRASTRVRSFSCFSIEKAINDVLSDLEIVVVAERATVTVEQPLPKINGDEIQLRQLFQNLISNSLKFRTPDRDPVIGIRCVQENEDQVSIEFSDNGVGFDPKYAQQIFSPFQRLHRSDQFPGAGIGLAIVKKILDRHHGTVEVASEPGYGAVFTLTFQRRPLVSLQP